MPSAKIRPLRPQATSQAKTIASQRRQRIHRRRLGILLTALVAILVVGIGAYVHTRQQIAQSAVTVTKAKHTLAKTKQQKAALKIQIDQLNDSDYLMKLVREKYLVSKKGEVVFALPGLASGVATTDK